jgi:hypothetical protein
MTELPGEFSLPREAFERQRSSLAAYVESGRGHSRGRRLGLAVAVAAFVVVVATATALGVRALIIEKGFVGLPPEGATPSTPEQAQLVAKLVGRSTTHESLLHVYLYDDGRLIRARHDGLVEQRLSQAGLEQLRSEILSTRLFDHDVALSSAGVIWGAVEARVSGRLVHVEWNNPDLAQPDPNGTTWVVATPEQERALERLDALLSHPTLGLPAGAWQDEHVRAYVPSTFAVCWQGWPADPSDPQSDPSRILSLLPPAARQLLTEKEATRHTGKRGWAGGPYYPSAQDCASVTTAEARSLSATLDDARVERTDPAAGLQYSFDLPRPSRERAQITFESLLPDGEWMNFRSG